MAIVLDEVKSSRIDETTGKKIVKCSLFADTKSEVKNNITGNDIERLEDNCDIDVGTFVMTADFQVAQLNSSHEWVWG